MLRIKNLKKSFDNTNNERTDVISISDFSLNDNEQVAVTGDSGSGKSTFLNLISGILESDSGEITDKDGTSNLSAADETDNESTSAADDNIDADAKDK